MSRQQITANNSLALYGVITAAVYLLTLIFYRKGPEVRSRTAREVFAWFLCFALLFLFWKGYQQINRADKPPIRSIVGFAVVLCLLAFLIFPFHSNDVFGYINFGWQQVHYGQNPYVEVLGNIPNWEQDQCSERTGFMFQLLTVFFYFIGAVYLGWQRKLVGNSRTVQGDQRARLRRDWLDHLVSLQAPALCETCHRPIPFSVEPAHPDASHCQRP